MIAGGLETNFREDLGTIVPQPIISHAWWFHFGVLGDPGRSWDIGEHNKGRFEVQAWDLCIFVGSRDPILLVLWVPWTTKGVFVHACPVFFF